MTSTLHIQLFNIYEILQIATLMKSHNHVSSNFSIFFPQLEPHSSLGKVEVSSPTTGQLTSGQAHVWTVWRWASAPLWRMEFWCASTVLQALETTSCSTLWVLFPVYLSNESTPGFPVWSRAWLIVCVEFYTVMFSLFLGAPISSQKHARGWISDFKLLVTCESVWVHGALLMDWSNIQMYFLLAPSVPGFGSGATDYRRWMNITDIISLLVSNDKE